MRILLTLAYEGTCYAGWQLQAPSQTKQTIQGCLERALHQLTRQKIRVHGSGRTDAGVHALGQRAHFDAPPVPAKWDWRKRLNAVLPHDIRVLASTSVPDSFHARESAVAKTYFYQFWTEPAWTPPHLRNWVWACGPINPSLIQPVLPFFLGKHDFASFQNSGSDAKNTIREIKDINMTLVQDQNWLPTHAPLLRLTITGTGFLKQMVRNLAGYLHGIGSGAPLKVSLKEIMDAASRAALPTPTAPARGLFMAKVDYGNSLE